MYRKYETQIKLQYHNISQFEILQNVSITGKDSIYLLKIVRKRLKKKRKSNSIPQTQSNIHT